MKQRICLTILASALLTASASAEPTPFRGTLEGQIISMVIEPPLAIVDVVGTGHCTYLGDYTYTFPHLVNFATLTAEGDINLVGADGSSISLHVGGTFAPTAEPFVLSVSVSGPIIAGTGRFANSSGTLTATATVNLATGRSEGSWSGEIELH